MKVFVTGVNGQLGHDCMIELARRGYEAVGSDIQEADLSACRSAGDAVGSETGSAAGQSAGDASGCETGSATDRSEGAVTGEPPYVRMDITDRQAVLSTIKAVRPDVIIHCAAWTAVDAAEDEENQPKVYAINAKGTCNVAEAARLVDAKMIYISTDYVFDGQGERPWHPDDRNYAPLNVYGKSKLEGELAVSSQIEKYFIVRIAWVFGVNGKNFIKTMLNVAKNHDTVRVVTDQIGTPTYTYDLARLLVDMAETDKYGYYHATNEGGFISWYDFTCEIYKQAKIETRVVPVTTKEYGLSKAERPFNSRLDKSKLVEAGFEPLPEWKDALARYLSVISAT